MVGVILRVLSESNNQPWALVVDSNCALNSLSAMDGRNSPLLN